MLKVSFAAKVLSLAFPFQLLANPYDSCKDILREGIHDTISSQSSSNRVLAVRQEFCSIAKENSLNEYNFEYFAKDYVSKTNSSKNSYGGNIKGGWKFLTIGAGYQQSNLKEDSSESDKIDFLKEHQKNILEYFNQHCGSESLDESIRTEAVMNSKIANPHVIKAWRDCMLERSSGFLVELVPSTTDLSGDTLEYSAVAHWQSKENTKLVSIVLTFRPDMMEVSASNVTTQNSYAKVDICEDKKCTLKSGSNLSVNILHKNRNDNLNITFEAKNEKGMMKTHIVTLPKKIIPPKIDLGDKDSYWAVESYCENLDCLQYMRDVSSHRHKIGEDFVASAVQLDPGTCNKCSKNKNLRFAFKNCTYKTKVQVKKGNVIVEWPEEISRDNTKYFYFYAEGRDQYFRMRIITRKNS